jgi:methionyl-tRNA formyltransferase
MRVLFWGTPDFAVPPLRALLGEGMDVLGVVTQPDKPTGRSRTLTAPPVKRVALDEGLRVFQPETPRTDEFVDALQRLRPDISVVVAYGHILPKRVIDLPELGTLNIHASLLPTLRGAAPIQGAIRQGLPETGISIMRMVPALDAGPVILQSRTPIPEDETYGELQLRLSELGALTLIEALALIGLGQATETPQDELWATYAPKIDRETTRINWTLPARDVARLIRAYDPKPGAYTTLHGVDVKCFGPTANGEALGLPGETLRADTTLTIACGAGAVSITDVQPAGKRRMPAREWLRGRSVAQGDRFGT